MGLAVAGLVKLCPDDSGRQGLAASCLSGYASGMRRDVNTCSGRRDSEDLPVREEDTRNELPAG